MKKRALCFILAVCVVFAFSMMALAEDPVSYGTITVEGTGIENQVIDVNSGGKGTLQVAKGVSEVSVSFSGTLTGVTLWQGSTQITSGTSVNLSGSYISLVVKCEGAEDQPFVLTLNKLSADIKSVNVRAGSQSFSASTSDSMVYTISGKISHAINQATIEVTPDSSNATVTIDGTAGTSKQVTLADGPNVFSIRVEAGGLSATYSVIIERYAASESTNANLASLALSGYSISPTFSASQTSYSVSVPYNVSSINVSATPEDSTSTLSYTWNNNTVNSTSSLALNTGTNTLRVRVTAANNTTTKDYYLTVTRSSATDSGNYYLSDVRISPSSGSADWSTSFRRATTSYTITIPKTATSVRFRPTAEASSATIKVDGRTVESGSYSNNISISSSSTTRVEIVVTAADGQRQTYTFKVSRSSSTSSSSDEATLKKLVVKYGSTTYDLMPAFDKDVEDYYVCVPEKADYVTITPTATESGSDIEVDGDDVSSGDASDKIDIDTGTSGNKIKIEVTSSDDSEDKTYTVYVYRASATSGSEKALDSLTLKTGKSTSGMTVADYTPSFSENTTSYTAYVDDAHKYVSVRASVANSKSLMFLIVGDKAIKLSDDSYSESISLPSDSSKVVIRVYNAMYSGYTDYTVKVSRGGSTENTLSSLILKDSSGQVVTLSPSFTRYTYSYTATVGTDVTGVRFYAVPRDSDATMKLDGVTLKSDTASSLITLSGTSTSIRLAVTATDGTVQNYNVTVKKGTDTTVGAVALSLKLGSSTILYNGVEKLMDVAPFTYQDRTMVPIRFVSTYLGATVDWNEATKTVTIKYGAKTLTMVVGKVNAAAGLDVAPMIKDNRTMVPLRYISEQFGAKVDWYASTKEIRISRQ